MRVWICCLGLLLLGLSACAPAERVYDSEAFVASKTYRHAGPPSITVITMVNNRSGSGAHSALMINASERVLFDPAGSFEHETIPERNDVLFGISPAVLKAYKGAHARTAYHVVSQEIVVTPEQAEAAFAIAKAHGAVGQAFCTQATTGVLKQVPGFSDIKSTYFPTNLMRQIEARGGAVTTERYFEDDEGTVLDGVAKVQL